jgi:amino acid adenylation domain-containing protein/thioester reductase-like protein
MMLEQLLATLRDLHVHLYVEQGNLKCKAPKHALSEDIKSQLKSKKAELIEALSQAGQESVSIMPGRRMEPLPLSYAQQRLWFLDRLEPDSSLYNMPYAFSLTGSLNEAALAQSFNEIVRRHENLRTVFVTDIVPAQAVSPECALSVADVDLKGLPEPLCRTVAADLSRQEAAKPFCLESGPLFRITLLALSCTGGRQEKILLVTLHHIVFDGWSAAILMREFVTLYQSFSRGEYSPLAALQVQYADFACWQRRKLYGNVLQEHIDYWRNTLDGAPGLLELPTDRPRPAVMSHCGASHRFEVPEALAEQVHQLSRRYGATLFMLLLTAFKILLFRYSRQQDICVGVPIANRNRLEIEGLIGFFVNTLIVRSDLSGNPQFDELLVQVRNTVLDAQNHQDLPFEQLVEALHPERNLSYSPLFQVMFVLQNQTGQILKLPDLAIDAIDDENKVSKFDLTLHIREDTGALCASLEYNTNLFDPATIARLAQQYVMLLQGVADAPQSRLYQLPLLTLAERKQILFDWNTTQAAYPADSCLHQLFEMQAQKAPRADALAFAGLTLSYAGLNGKANQVAHYLRSIGVGPDVAVGLCVDRSPEMAVGMLGIIKAGGAYVPIDPQYPEQRIAYMLNDARIDVLLTRQALAEALPHNAKYKICLDSDWRTIGQWPDVNPALCNHPLDLAYIIYTSGTTGLPKGVMVSHRNAVHSTTARFDSYRVPVDAYLLLSSFAFDSSVAGLFWTLGQGGCLCLPTDDAAKDPAALADIIAKRRVSHLLALPSFYALLLKQERTKLQTLKTAIVAGETCSTEVVKRHYAILPDVPLYNEYGPTEGSVWSSVYLADRDDLDRPLSIGGPIDNVRLYILDRSGNPVPVGVPGELYIGGEGTVRGYWRRPELTAEKFIPDPFRNDGGRLYKTGDLARYRPDGNIEFSGRIDDQVKIRGFRIELGEIEARLLEHPDVDEAVVLVRENLPGNKLLIAYVVGGDQLTAETLQESLRASLPGYMLPGAVIFLARMPLTANGKIDRKALPAPDMANVVSRRYVEPETRTEKALAAIWCGILGIGRAGRYDDFFRLGGHSLLAAQLPVAVRKQFNIQLPLKSFFEMTTVAAQARLIDTGESEAAKVDFEAEAELDPTIIPLPLVPINVAAAQTLFLTGATGFLGAFLLAELLQQTDAKIYCLVRAVDEQQALARLQRQIVHYELQDGIDWRRIVAVCGDLAEPRFGLSELRYKEIAEEAEVIYHNGALVNFIQPYHALKPANVLGTEAALRLACYRKAKALHYVSTLSVFNEVSTNPKGHRECDEPMLCTALANGYAQSKWVAEKLLRLAAGRGFQVTVYRPATVAGDSRTGNWNTEDFLCRVIKACIQMGCAPAERVRMDMAPVDYISRSIVALSLQPDSAGAYFHLNHPSPPYSDELINSFNRLGYRLDRMPYQDWVKKVLEIAEAGKITDFALSPLLSLFSDQSRGDGTESLEENSVRYDCHETQSFLSKIGIECVLLDSELLTRYQAYFKRSGFISEPEHYHKK